MNISSLLKTAAYQPMDRIAALGLGKSMSQAGQDFDAINASLKSGDLSSAKSSFNDLKKVLQSAGSIGAANTVRNDFDLLGKALGSGDVSSAQHDLEQLQNDVKSIVQQNHEHAPGLPIRVPGVNLYQAGLSAISSIGRTLSV